MDQRFDEISELNTRISELQAFLKCTVSRETTHFINDHIEKIRDRLVQLQQSEID
jgi:hypothetical protein